MFYLFLFLNTMSWNSSVYFTLMVYLSSDKRNFKCSIVIYGWCLLYWTAQFYIFSITYSPSFLPNRGKQSTPL